MNICFTWKGCLGLWKVACEEVLGQVLILLQLQRKGEVAERVVLVENKVVGMGQIWLVAVTHCSWKYQERCAGVEDGGEKSQRELYPCSIWDVRKCGKKRCW